MLASDEYSTLFSTGRIHSTVHTFVVCTNVSYVNFHNVLPNIFHYISQTDSVCLLLFTTKRSILANDAYVVDFV